MNTVTSDKQVEWIKTTRNAFLSSIYTFASAVGLLNVLKGLVHPRKYFHNLTSCHYKPFFLSLFLSFSLSEKKKRYFEKCW